MKCVLLLFIFHQCALAQPTEESNWKVGGYFGPYLPSANPGITEIMKAWGARASYFDGTFGYEMFAFRSAEDGAVINYMGGSMVKGMRLEGISDVTVLVLGGLQGTYNRRAAQGATQYPFGRNMGIHMGGGVLLPLTGNLFVRGGTTIFNGPGRAVLVEGGLQYSFGGATKEEDAK